MKNRNTIVTLLSLAGLACTAVAAHAQQPLLSATVGSGNAESYLVIDFENGTSTAADQSYAFGYLYTQPANGTQLTPYDMIQALAADGIGFSYTATPYSLTDPTTNITTTEDFIDSFTYDGLTETGNDNNYWAYYRSDDPSDWQYADAGVNNYALTDGSYDGFAYTVGDASPTPNTPLASAAPEPSEAGMIGLMAVGLGGLLIRAKRRA